MSNINFAPTLPLYSPEILNPVNKVPDVTPISHKDIKSNLPENLSHLQPKKEQVNIQTSFESSSYKINSHKPLIMDYSIIQLQEVNEIE